LVRRAEGGEEIILTRHGQSIARITSLAPDPAERRAALEEARGIGLVTHLRGRGDVAMSTNAIMALTRGD
jgi:antitoxin (DNA-binding transcriptional repressor) of toxin-antitoxin stability system